MAPEQGSSGFLSKEWSMKWGKRLAIVGVALIGIAAFT